MRPISSKSESLYALDSSSLSEAETWTENQNSLKATPVKKKVRL